MDRDGRYLNCVEYTVYCINNKHKLTECMNYPKMEINDFLLLSHFLQSR